MNPAVCQPSASLHSGSAYTGLPQGFKERLSIPVFIDDRFRPIQATPHLAHRFVESGPQTAARVLDGPDP